MVDLHAETRAIAAKIAGFLRRGVIVQRIAQLSVHSAVKPRGGFQRRAQRSVHSLRRDTRVHHCVTLIHISCARSAAARVRRIEFPALGARGRESPGGERGAGPGYGPRLGPHAVLGNPTA